MTEPEASTFYDIRRSRSGSERRQRQAQQKTRFTPEEHAELKARADGAGMSINSYIRHQTLGKAGPRSVKKLPIDQVLVRQLIGEISRIGNNLNQLTRLGNLGDLEGADLRELELVWEKVNDTLDACLSAIGR